MLFYWTSLLLKRGNCIKLVSFPFSPNTNKYIPRTTRISSCPTQHFTISSQSFSVCFHTPFLCYSITKHTRCQPPELSGGHRLCSAAGPGRLWPTTDPTQTHTPGSSSVASHRQRRRSKGASAWHVSLKPCSTTPAPPRLPPGLSPPSWHGSWRSRSPTETSHHRSLTRAERLGGFSQVFLTHPVPESHSAAGRLQPFVTLPVRAWLRLTGDGCVKQVSKEGRRKGRGGGGVRKGAR